jgi:YHS domain-containing protein
MTLAPASAAASLVHAGTCYYFCSDHCAQQFRHEPDSFSVSGTEHSSP